MHNTILYRLNNVSVVDITGADAIQIVHNLTTNDVKSLDYDAGCETFVTEVRGKTLGHVHLYRHRELLRMIGAAGQSAAIAAHAERYTIREDATPLIRDDEFVALVLSQESSAALNCALPQTQGIFVSPLRCGDVDVSVYRTRWLGDGTLVLLVPQDSAEAVFQWMVAQSLVSAGEEEFHQARTLVGFPWYGIDLDDKNLPQEADRDPLAVSFTKGCYLGQETVARLDALGQVQKKLVRWSITGCVPAAGSTVGVGEKLVGRLSSVAAAPGGSLALGMARRSHFEPGSTASGTDLATGNEFTATVVK